jgi:hypothetical protein
LPQSDNPDALLSAVEAALGDLEALCGRIERALMLRRWPDLEAAIADSRRVTHALQNAMDEARSVRTGAFDEGVFRRLHYVHAIRENQMTRLQQYHDAVGERLRLIARWKSALRSIAVKLPSTGVAALNEMR